VDGMGFEPTASSLRIIISQRQSARQSERKRTKNPVIEGFFALPAGDL
jgi:hypothetical protein